jgi:hypothetical protein
LNVANVYDHMITYKVIDGRNERRNKWLDLHNKRTQRINKWIILEPTHLAKIHSCLLGII